MIQKDGFKTIISFANIALLYAEKDITPPGYDGRGPIDTSTMRNTKYVTKWPKSLIDVTNTMVTVAYDPLMLEQIRTQCNKIQFITVTFPDLRKASFYGFVNSFKPNPSKEGEQPTAVMEVVSTNQNPAGAETEVTIG